MSNAVSLKSLGEIIDEGTGFLIPKYQRGYRWEAEQIDALLDDLVEFCKEIENKKETEEIYCLQPLVVKYDEENDKYDVIDGQQRLTTITIILKFLDCEYNYSIEYETRKEGKSSIEFLDHIKNKTETDAAENADFYYMFHARKTVDEFFKKKKDVDKDAFVETIKKRVNFVWYELDPQEDAVKVFKRLNIGKIKLTESELIKAMFLNSNNFSSSNSERGELLSLVEMANDWDRIEYRLQDDRFWLFFHDTEYNKPTRIDFIFDLIRKEDDKSGQYTTEKYTYPTFSFFYDEFNRKENKENKLTFLTAEWKKVKKYYSILEEWYNDDVFFHYIGYLCAIGSSAIESLFKEWNKCNDKAEFKKKLEKRIAKKIKNCNNLDRDYFEKGKDNKGEARPILLLHNVLTVIAQNNNIENSSKYNLPDFNRFPFHLFKKENWDVEHIRPNNLQEFDGERKKNERAKYVFVQHEYYKGKIEEEIEEKYRNYIEKYKAKEDEAEAFDEFIEALNQLEEDGNTDSQQLDEDEKNKIWNYVLLDASTNREYGNSCYAIKRDFVMKKKKGKKPVLKVKDNIDSLNDNEDIIEKDYIDEVAFVPICTENVFSKAYSQYPNNLNVWSKKDAEAYKEDIAEICKEFFE